MKYRLREITYRIDDYGNSKEVQGYALDWPTVRLCFRQTVFGWRCDHYDSGYRAGPYYSDIVDAISNSILLFEHNIQSGKYAAIICNINSHHEG